MQIMKKIFFSFFLIFTLCSGYSQSIQNSKQQKEKISRGEFFILMGGAYYIGDLNPGKHYALTQPAGGIGIRYNFDTRLAARGNIFLGSVKGEDASSLSMVQKERNLQFKSSIFEISGQGEFNFMKYWMGEFKFLFTHYVFLGAGIFKFRPQALTNSDNWIDLQPLGTEGQSTTSRPGDGPKIYRLTQFSIPFGIGVKINVAEKIGLSVEWGMRKTFTDYIDDVSTTYADPAILNKGNASKTTATTLADRSIHRLDNTGRQRGNSQNKDWYCFSGIILSFAFTKPPPKCYAY